MPAGLVKTFRKTSAERRRMYLNYDCWLEDAEKLTDSQVLISPYTEDSPISVTSGYVDAAQRKLVMFVAGGVPNTDYVLTMTVRTDAGQIKQDSIGLRVTV